MMSRRTGACRTSLRKHRLSIAILAGVLGLLRIAEVALAGFQAPQYVATAEGAISIAVADFNGDGRPDLAVANYLSSTVTSLLNRGNGIFEFRQSLPISGQPRSIATADINLDGKPDLVVANSNEFTVQVLIGLGQGYFGVTPTMPLLLVPGVVALADVNSDGKPDLIVGAWLDSTVTVFFGNGDGTFVFARNTSGGERPRSIVVADFDRDGKLDLATAAFNGNDVHVLLGRGDGSFSYVDSKNVGGQPIGLAAADLNGDGYLDLAVANSNSNSVGVLLGLGAGAISTMQTFATGADPEALATADLNGDGILDLAVTNSNSNTLSVLIGNGDGTYQPQQVFATGGEPAGIIATDLDADGRPDLALANYANGNVLVLRGAVSGSLQFSSPTFTASEGAGAASVTLTRTGSTDGQVSAVVSLTGGTALQGTDFTLAAPQTVTWTDGDGAQKTVSIPITQDQIDETDETIRLTVALPEHPFGARLGGPTTTTLTLADDDPAPILSLANVSIPEGNAGSTSAVFTVTRTGATAHTVTVQYATSDGSANSGTDFTSATGTLTFAPGEATQTIAVPIIGDTVSEGNETFVVTLSNPTNATILAAQATGTIQNDDATTTCGPRPPVTQTLTAAGDALAVQVRPSQLNGQARNAIGQIRFGVFQNATVTLDGQPMGSGQTVTFSPGVSLVDFRVRRVAAGQSTTVAFTITDGCGEWSTFVGGGAGAGF